MSKAPKLTDKQQAFISEYLKCWNATKAALQAGYSEKSARQIGAENLSKPYIADEIQHRISEMKMSADEAITSLADIARGSMSDFIKVQAGVPIIDFEKAERNGKLHLLKKITYGKGTISFEMYDKQAALNTIAKHHGLLNEKVEIDIKLVGQAVEALEALGQDPAAVFNEIIARAKAKQHASS
jgi:phage terminase small subunit